MENNRLLKQAIDYNRNLFNGAFRAWTQAQENIGQLTGNALSQTHWLPEDGKTALSGWTGACKQGQEEYRKAVNEGFNKLEELFGHA